MWKKKVVDIEKLFFSKLEGINSSLHTAFSTGNWGVSLAKSSLGGGGSPNTSSSSFMRTGVSQILQRFSHSSYLSHLNRLLAPVSKDGSKSISIRQVAQSTIGFIDAHETPEGITSGLVKNLTSHCRVTQAQNKSIVLDIIEETLQCFQFYTNFDHLLSNKEEDYSLSFVFLNGNVIGFFKKHF